MHLIKRVFIILSVLIVNAILGFTGGSQTVDKIPLKTPKSVNITKSEVIKNLRKIHNQIGLDIKVNNKKTDENGSEITIGVKLKSKPIDDVYVIFSSDNIQEGRLTNHRLHFSVYDWNQSKYTTVVGQDDNKTDGDQAYQLVLKTESKKDYGYANLKMTKITLLNEDNDIAKVVVPKKMLTVSEGGTVVSFTTTLSTEPLNPVTLYYKSGDKNEIRIEKIKLVLTADNWKTGIRNSITGIDDQFADGNRKTHVIIYKTESHDKNYNLMKPIKINVTNKDNDSAKIIIQKTSGITNEDGKSVVLKTKLATKPLKNVTIQLNSSKPDESIISTPLIYFNRKNWNKFQSIKITGKNDNVVDGNKQYKIIFNTSKSNDLQYARLKKSIIPLVNYDNDTANIKVVSPKNNRLKENGSIIRLPIKISTKPKKDVTLNILLDKQGQLIVIPNQLKFTAKDWDKTKYLEVRSIDDAIIDGEQTVNILINASKSEDSVYTELKTIKIPFVSVDNDEAGVLVSKTSGVTSESAGEFHFSVKLLSEPLETILIPIQSSNNMEGIANTEELKFKPNNWNEPQSVLITGLDDTILDGDKTYQIMLKTIKSNDKNYHHLDPPDIKMVNIDNEKSIFSLNLLKPYVTEGGDIATLEIVLNQVPDSNTKIKLSSSDEGEGLPLNTELTFTSDNWSIPQTVEIKGVDDDINDGNVNFKITAQIDDEHSKKEFNVTRLDVQVENKDNDIPGVFIKMIDSSTVENGENGKFSIALKTKPKSSVLILFKSSDLLEGNLVQSNAYFSQDNWNKEQIIEVEGVKDFRVDDLKPFEISIKNVISSDMDYNNLSLLPLKFKNRNTDTAEFIVSPLVGFIDENGGTATFTINLSSIPQNTIHIEVFSSDETEAILHQTQLTFNEENWQTPQLITITGVDDFKKDEDQDVYIKFNTAVSEDPFFHGKAPASIKLNNLNNSVLALITGVEYLMPMAAFKGTFNNTVGLNIKGEYLYTKIISLLVEMSNSTFKGSDQQEKYGTTHNLDYNLYLFMLELGARYILYDNVVMVYGESFIGLCSWTLKTKDKTANHTKNTSNVDLSTKIAVGSNFPISDNLIAEATASYLLITGGLNNNTFLGLGVGLKYSF